MTARADFTDQEWETLREGPASAGMLVILAHRGGSVRETISMAKAYADAQRMHGRVDLLGLIVADKPEVDRPPAHSTDEVRAALAQSVRDAVAVAEAKADAQEAAAYRAFVLEVALRVANARREGFLGLHGERVGPEERAALEQVAQAVDLPLPEG
jgi:hypothetical protein